MLSTYLYLEKTDEAFGHVITFLSIITGFSITALSIIATSNFAKVLYQQEDPKDNSRTLLHKLTNIFKNCILYSAIGVVAILGYFYLKEIEFETYYFWCTSISVKNLIVGIIWFVTIIAIVLFVKLVFMFSKFVIQSAKRQ